MSTPLIMPLVTTSKLTNAWRSQRVMADGVNSGLKKMKHTHFLMKNGKKLFGHKEKFLGRSVFGILFFEGRKKLVIFT